jgi:hypothetical protein
MYCIYTLVLILFFLSNTQYDIFDYLFSLNLVNDLQLYYVRVLSLVLSSNGHSFFHDFE